MRAETLRIFVEQVTVTAARGQIAFRSRKAGILKQSCPELHSVVWFFPVVIATRCPAGDARNAGGNKCCQQEALNDV